MEPNPRFECGETIRRKDAPDVVGLIVGTRWNPQLGQWVYRIRFGGGLREVPEDVIELLPEVQEPWDDLASGSFATASTFRTMMTFERLRKPPSRIAASFGSAKAAFYPFQFKPLLKFLENPAQRLLIADEVGLGKTIEAGYILRELRARGHVERVLIVVPSRLREKWRAELQRRFDERFDLISATDLLTYLDRVARGRSPEPFLWIGSLESLRRTAVIERLGEYSPLIDLVVFDEAHRLRNRSTLQHRLGEALSQVADAMLFLTATPVQTSQENLFTLLHLLDPETFADPAVFMQQLQSQQPILKALQAIRTSPPNAAVALRELVAVTREPAYHAISNTEFFASIRERLGRIGSLGRRQRVELERDLSELCFTSAIISRTRKGDVLPDRPRRTAQSVLLHFTPQERAIYDDVERLCALINPSTAGWGRSMGVLMAYRYTASCIPAAVEYFHHRLKGSASLDESLYKDLPEETEHATGWREGDPGAGDTPREDHEIPRGQLRAVQYFESRIRDGHVTVPPIDTKFNRLKEVLNEVWRHDDQEGRNPRKVVVFSFFKRTLRYLEQRLREADIGCVRIDGSVSLADREVRIERFATTDGIRVLLSSEVGGEGIDLQFASVLVNYDLPWNPMVLEQRIGRLDRIGQKSDRIVIFNFAVQNTIEQRILLRLYERIGIFQDTIGEIDPILGRKIEELTLEALTGNLTPEEQEQLADKNADAAIREWQTARALTSEADALLAADQAFLDEVQSLLGRRRLPNAEDLARFFIEFVQKRYPGSRVSHRLATRAETIHLPTAFATDLQRQLGHTNETNRISSLIQRGRFLVTFDSSALAEHPTAEHVHGRHPLIRFVMKRLEQEDAWSHRCFALRIPGQENERLLVFSIYLIEFSGTRPHTDLVTIAYDVRNHTILDPEASEEYLVSALAGAEAWDPPPSVDPTEARSWHEKIERTLDEYLSQVLDRERSLNAARVTRRRETIEQTLKARLSAAERRLSKLKESRARDFPIRMAEARVERERKALERFRSEILEESQVHYEQQHVAVGMLYTTTEGSISL